MQCLNCNKDIKSKIKKFCDNACQNELSYKNYIKRWKSGLVSGGSKTGVVSNHVRRYLFEKFENKCSRCGWNHKNPVTGKIPLQAEHQNGNSRDHRESNLILLCPNCHSLTPTYGNLNRGNGRKLRKR
jgi:hypothetical protein